MGFGNLGTAFNLDPATVSSLESQYGPTSAPRTPVGVLAPPPEDGAPSYEELQRYGAQVGKSPEQIEREAAVAARANGPAAGAGNPSNPVVADPRWDPEAEQRRVNEEAGKKERAAATPQGPAGDDGFPTYRDLNNTGSAMQTAPAGPARTVAAHWQPGTRSESRQHMAMDPALVEGAQYNKDLAAGLHLEEGDLRLQAAKEQGQADAVYAAANAAASQQAAAKAALVEQERAAYVMREREKLETLSLAAQEKVDPEAAKGSSGAQLFAAIGIALGQFGASLTGGQNTALQIVHANIDRRIDAQKTNIANAGRAHDRETSLYKDNLAQFGDKQRAVLATKVMYLDQVRAMADQQYAHARGTSNEAQYKAFQAGVATDRAKAAEDLAKLTGVQVATQGNEHYVPTQVVGGGAGGAKGKEALYVPSLQGYARDAETAKKLNSSGAQRMQINEDLHHISGLLKEAHGLNSVTDYGRMQEIRQEIDSRKANVLQRTTVLRGQGAMSKGDQDVAEVGAQLANMDPQLKTEAQIKRMQKGVQNVARLHMQDHRLEGESNGIQLGREEYRQGANGPEPVARLAGRNKVVTKKTENHDDVMEKPKGVPDRK
jgi:hypothetical protein